MRRLAAPERLRQRGANAITTPSLPAGADVFVIATGLLADLPRQATGFDLLAVGPDGALGFIRQNPVVYALHASLDAPAVDIFAGSAKIVADLAFRGLSAPVPVPPGSYSLAFYGASSGTEPTGTAAATESLPDLAAGERYLAIATGFLAPKAGQPGFELLEKSDKFDLTDTANARVRVVHASPDAPAVDVGAASGTTLTSVLVRDLSFTHTSPLSGLSVPPATLDLGVAPTGSTATAPRSTSPRPPDCVRSSSRPGRSRPPTARASGSSRWIRACLPASILPN